MSMDRQWNAVGTLNALDCTHCAPFVALSCPWESGKGALRWLGVPTAITVNA